VAQIPLEDIIIHKVSGALTNAVFFVSCPTVSSVSTLLLRIYGSSSESLISRPKELHILHILSSQYKIGPRLYGTFENGRIEEYFDSMPLTAADIRNPQISRWIGARMAELHSVDLDKVDGTSGGKVFEIATHIKSWVASAKEVLRLPSVSDSTRQELDLSRFKDEWNRYLAWATREGRGLGSKRVFAHNDAQYGNLLRLKDSREGIEEHRQVCSFFPSIDRNTSSDMNSFKIIVVDFEYAGPNPAAYDIANHFQEWTADYYSHTPHLLNPSRYPTLEERCNFYTSYLRHACMLAEVPIIDENKLANLVKDLEWDVRIWSAASHAGWAIWGIVQAKEDLESNNADAEFDYIQYAKGRMASFRELIQTLGI